MGPFLRIDKQQHLQRNALIVEMTLGKGPLCVLPWETEQGDQLVILKKFRASLGT